MADEAKKGGSKGPVEQGKTVLPSSPVKNVQGENTFGGKDKEIVK